MKRLLFSLFVATFLFLAPQVQAVTTINYTSCAIWSFEGNGSCTGSSVISASSNGGAFDGTPTNNLGTATWYVSFIVNSGTVVANCGGCGCTGTGPGTKGAGSYVDLQYISACTQGLYFHNNTAWNVSNICISDTVGQCVAAPAVSAFFGWFYSFWW